MVIVYIQYHEYDYQIITEEINIKIILKTDNLELIQYDILADLL